MLKVLFIFGTRPEAIKLCPVLFHLRARRQDFEVRVCVTAQHRSLLDQVLGVFDVVPDHDLDVMRPGQTLAGTTARILASLEPVIAGERPDMVLVQGDTSTTLCGALAAFYQRVPVGHVEAGLRTGDLEQPFPEEMNRLLSSRVSTLHFAPTRGAARNLAAEGVAPERICISGNPGVDAVLYVRDALNAGKLSGREWPWLDRSRKLILVTGHRRESFGAGFESLCRALTRLAARPDVQIVYPVHPNPEVLDPVRRFLERAPHIVLLEPLDYVSFVDLMRRSYFLITDSGGIQEEAPSLGKPVLVTREKTERPEAVEAGTVKLVGTDEARIVREASDLLDDPAGHARMSTVHNPYGDGQAGARIADAIGVWFRTGRLPVAANSPYQSARGVSPGL